MRLASKPFLSSAIDFYITIIKCITGKFIGSILLLWMSVLPDNLMSRPLPYINTLDYDTIVKHTYSYFFTETYSSVFLLPASHKTVGVVTNVLYYGAPSETRTRTPKHWLLRPACLPIPPSGHKFQIVTELTSSACAVPCCLTQFQYYITYCRYCQLLRKTFSYSALRDVLRYTVSTV